MVWPIFHNMRVCYYNLLKSISVQHFYCIVPYGFSQEPIRIQQIQRKVCPNHRVLEIGVCYISELVTDVTFISKDWTAF